MASGGPSCSTPVEGHRESVVHDSQSSHAASANRRLPSHAASAAAAESGRGRKAQKVATGSSARLERIESGVDQIIALLVRLQLARQNARPTHEVEPADSHELRLQSREPQQSLADAAAAAAAGDGYSSSSRHASCESVHDCGGVGGGGKDVAYWRRRSAELQDTVDALVVRLESQAAQLDSRLEEARRQREAAAEERLELQRRLGSFRRQLDASQTARARLHSALESAEAELARLKGTAASHDIEETVEALTAQLDMSNQQLRDMAQSRECLRQRAEQLQALLREDGGGLVRSCSCDQRLHQCCKQEEQPPQRQPQLQAQRQQRQTLSDHGGGEGGGNVSEPSGDSSRSSKSFRTRFLRRKKSRVGGSDD